MPGEEAPPSLDGAAGRGQGAGRDVLLASVASLDFCGPLSRGETRCAVPTVAGPVERSCLQPACSEAPGLGMECPSPLPTQPLSWPDFPTALLRVPACSHCGGHPSPSPAQAAREMGLKLRLLGGSCPVPCVLPHVLPRVPEGRWLLSTCLSALDLITRLQVGGLGGAPSGPALAQSPAAYTHSF